MELLAELPETNWIVVLCRLVFTDVPDFRPTLTPKEVIQAGSFGG